MSDQTKPKEVDPEEDYCLTCGDDSETFNEEGNPSCCVCANNEYTNAYPDGWTCQMCGDGRAGDLPPEGQALPWPGKLGLDSDFYCQLCTQVEEN